MGRLLGGVLAGLLVSSLGWERTAWAQSPTGRLAPTPGPARLQILDKVTARVREISVPLERRTRFETLEVMVAACWRSLPLEIPEAVAWLSLDEYLPGPLTAEGARRGRAAKRGDRAADDGAGDGISGPPAREATAVFRGWLFASTPSVSSVEHPVYDVVLLSCGEDPTP